MCAFLPSVSCVCLCKQRLRFRCGLVQVLFLLERLPGRMVTGALRLFPPEYDFLVFVPALPFCDVSGSSFACVALPLLFSLLFFSYAFPLLFSFLSPPAPEELEAEFTR